MGGPIGGSAVGTVSRAVSSVSGAGILTISRPTQSSVGCLVLPKYWTMQERIPFWILVYLLLRLVLIHV